MGKCPGDQLRPCCPLLLLQRKLADVSTVDFNSTPPHDAPLSFPTYTLFLFTLTLFADGFFFLHNSLSILYLAIRSTTYCVLYIYIPTSFPRNDPFNLIHLLRNEIT